MTKKKKEGFKTQTRKGGAVAHANLIDPGVYIFVDDQNLWIGAKEGTFRIDFGELMVVAARDEKGVGRGVRKAVISGTIPPEDSFWQIARDQGFEVRLGYRGFGGRSKQDDTHLVADLVEVVCTAGGPATVVLVAGDGDYGPALQKALSRGWRVEVLFVERDFSHALNQYAHLVRFIRRVSKFSGCSAAW